MYYFEIKSFLKNHSHIEAIYEEFHKKSHLSQNKIGVSFPYQNNGLLNSIQNNNFIEKKFFETNKMELDKLLKKNIEVITEDIILANDSIINFPKFIKGFEEKKDVVDLVKKVVNDKEKETEIEMNL